jgi:Rps23 Pro-64 3,4-dihydroxylase Tpa1-like proline 4-hydroxylase
MCVPKGYKFSEESKKKMSKSQMGHKFSEETRRKMSKTRIGRNLSEEVRRKISESNKGNKFRLNKNHSSETKIKMSESRKGENHPNWKGGCIEYLHSKARKYFFTGYCEICGKTNAQEKKEVEKGLSMHNTLVPKDYKIMNINAWICICQSCHSKID